jgi:branched-chain amino acid transport system ATP-binding protein
VLDQQGKADAVASGPLLEVRSLSVKFGGILALAEVSLDVATGESVGLVGPNGAGKTTLFNCVCGQITSYKGSVLYEGRPIDRAPVFQRAKLGIARTFQRIEVFSELTVREHMLVAERARRGDGALWKDLLNMGRPTADEQRRAEEVLELVGLRDVADTPVAALPLGLCRLVELGRALALEPKLILADEPSSGLDTRETATLASLLRNVQRQRSTAILLVEHDLDMVAEVVDRAVVLDFGHVIASGPLTQVIADPAVRKAYLGKTA